MVLWSTTSYGHEHTSICKYMKIVQYYAILKSPWYYNYRHCPMVHQSLNHCPDSLNAITFWTASKSATVFNANGFRRASEERFVVNKAALSVPCPINILQEPFVTTATPECPCPHGPIDQFCAVNSAELSITSPREETALSVASWFPPASHQPRGGADRWWEAEPYITVMKKQY